MVPTGAWHPDWGEGLCRAELTELDPGAGCAQHTDAQQITDFFLRAGVEPPLPFVEESLSAKIIGELVAANERAVSIVPADVAEELVRIAGVGMVAHRFGWTFAAHYLVPAQGRRAV